ncbi:unnamed protein product [Urochloa decumbens]|uniref:Dirigent protein n=1 Tax=Urochloa decumbens TaxID=240449 RepID=A0ABC8ZS09_9POAL
MASKKPAAIVTLSSLLLLLLLIASRAAAARPTRQLTSGDDIDGDDTGAAAAAAGPAPAAATAVAPVPADAPTAATATPAAAAPAGAAAASGGAAAAAPLAASTIPAAAGPVAANPAAGGDHGMVFFMHDILGGTNPSARIVAGIVDNAAITGQLPFARPNGAVLPLNSGVNVNSGAAGAIDNNNIPFLTGLGGATNAVKSINNNNGGGNAGIPVFAGGSLPQGTTLQKLLFGTMTVVDDELTEAPELGSAAVGRAQGFYIASSEEGVSQTVAVTAMFKEGGFEDTLSFFGVHRTADSESHLAVVGGTGKYVGAKGFAKVAVVRPGGVAASGALLETDGVETVLQFTVFLV